MGSLIFQFFDLFGRERKAPIDPPDEPVLPTPQTPSAEPHAPTPASAVTLQPLVSWNHPFKDKKSPLDQLTQLAKAASGYYPLGRNGLWHGGVHFDSGTAGTLDQTSVHCLADGEVVAYRIDEYSPTSTYFVNELCALKPFSRNFVLVRHCLEAPKIEGCTDAPPSLIFYSLYMHLQDWAVYRDDASVARPAFWSEGQARWVKATTRDALPGHPAQLGLNVRNQAQGGKVLTLLPRGAQVTVSGEGEYRKLENTNGPDALISADGSLRGYLSYEYLVPIAGGEYRVKASSLKVRAEPNARLGTEAIMELPHGSEVVVSGEGEFGKLERVNQYVHFNSLEGALEPIANRIVVLDQPIAIKAGDLIGHIGEYQDGGAEHPEKKLHLEVFSDDDVETFIEVSRAWAQRLPATGKTWLKLAKGTAVVTHQEHFSAIQPPTLNAASTPSDADLLVPKSLLDGLPADKKIVISATAERKACNWYRLEGLLHDANSVLLDGWVLEEVGVTQWFDPWSWEGYDVIFNYDSPRQTLASFLRAANRFSEEQIERHGALADISDNGPLKSRLYDIIDRDHDGKMTAEELQAAISLPAHAQSLSKLIIHNESEWRHEPHKWDALDEVLGHSGSTPHLNWLAEKERIKQVSWWGEVAPKLGLPAHGQVYHLHFMGLGGWFAKLAGLINVDDFLMLYEQQHALFSSGTRALSQGSKENLRKIVTSINLYYDSSLTKANLYEVAYMLATVRHEAYYFPAGEFFSEEPEVGNAAYFNKYDPVLASTPEHRTRARENGNTERGDGYKYRGRGCVHLTWKNNYRKFSALLSVDFVSNPDAAAKFEYSIPIMIIGMTEGMFTGKKLADYINANGVNYMSARRIINGIDEQALIASYAERFENILKQTSQLPAGF
ncbi:hypothetical protein N4P55_12780 [Pseudomonas fluorescens]|uniref:hypothetical protein n=1 Tax=Pseudomonas fluorescens TaxID=294 RepID=UPI0021D0D9CB|nr:hypothetical protein [Pseudomonas fluorescens]UXV22188.1 hypothetical protein N4P55_12780 [Pseudomonas fluorescens]